MYEILISLVSILGITLFYAFIGIFNPKIYFNSSYDYNSDKQTPAVKLKELIFTVRKVEFCYTKGGLRHIAKYTVETFYQSGKNSFRGDTFCFFAEQGKYNVGDVLTLENLKTYSENKATIQKAVGYLTSRTGLYASDIEMFKKYMEE